LKTRGPKKRKKTCFVSWKAYFFLFLFFHYSFSFALQRWFLELQVATPKTFLNHSKWSTYDEDINKCLVIGRWSVMGQSTLNVNDFHFHWIYMPYLWLLTLPHTTFVRATVMAPWPSTVIFLCLDIHALNSGLESTLAPTTTQHNITCRMDVVC
jgi:hypothetical protein